MLLLLCLPSGLKTWQSNLTGNIHTMLLAKIYIVAS